MATFTWVRSSFAPMPWNTVKTYRLISTQVAGQTIVRLRFGWSFGGWTSTTVIPTAILGQEGSFGLVTTVGPAGTDQPPDPITQGADVAPPAQRWLWLERRSVRLKAWDPSASTALWEDSGPSEPTDGQGQVLAPNMVSGSTLNLWAVCEGTEAWDGSGQAVFWFFVNVLVRTP